MIKNIYFAAALSMISLTALGDVNAQLAHLQTELKAIKRSLQEAKTQIKLLSGKIDPQLVEAAKVPINKILSSQEFINKMNSTTSSQSTKIANGASYKDVKYIPNLADYLPTAKVSPFVTALYNAMANEKYRLLLWQKITLKERVLIAELEKILAEEMNYD